MHLSDFDYDLPAERIAQTPLADRTASKLLVLERPTGRIAHKRFGDILDYVRPGDILVANNSHVLPARLHAQKKETGGRVELLLLAQIDDHSWRVLVGGKNVTAGVSLRLFDRDQRPTEILATVLEVREGAQRLIRFSQPSAAWLESVGHLPLPPYIHQPLADPQRYQTVYAQRTGSAAAPTAGLHFTPELLLALRDKGVLFETVTLHIGLDTFKPVTAENIAQHPIHSEWATLTAGVARRINEAKLAGGRLIAVGTTSVRTLETAAWRSAGVRGSLKQVSQEAQAAACPWQPVRAFEGPTDLYIYPGYRFRAVDGLITNFHLPRSTLMMLISAFAGRDLIAQAYRAALQGDYRFLSLGDAMFIL